MRIIAGHQQRRKLVTPKGLDTRPVLDRVKQALFDALGSRYGLPGHVPPLSVLDLFCGGGTLGIEALSRGAAWCAFVERSPAALRCLRSNLAATGLAGAVVAGPAESVPIPAPPQADGYDLIFMDPPFPLSAAFAPAGPLGRVFARLGGDVPVAADALCIWRYEADIPAPESTIAGWRTVARRKYGRSMLSWLERDAAVA